MRIIPSGLKPIVLLVLLLIAFQWLSAQTGTIRGTVKDADGNPLSGASITVKGKKTGTLSDASGNYLLKLPPGKYVLQLSFVGQKPQEAAVILAEGASVEQHFITESAPDLDNIVILGSRVRDVRAKIATPVPVDIIRMKEITGFAQAEVGQILTYAAPSFQANRQTVVDGTDHIDPASLRGLGPDQTLVLLNGKRRHNTALVNINGSVGRGSVGTDLNAIPAAAIDHLEVLRDGAAAQYGSDAIAGVINVVLKKRYRGLNITGTLGENMTTQWLSRPQDLSREKRYIIDGVNNQVDFDWGLTGSKNAYLNISGQWLQRGRSDRGGIDNSPLLYYGNASLPAPPSALNTTAKKTDFLQWLMNQDAALATQRGFDRRDMIIGNSYSNNFLGFINAGTDISPAVSLYFTAGIGHRKGDATGNYRLPSGLGQQPANPDSSLYYPNGFLPHISPVINDLSGLLGANVKLGSWDMDISTVTGGNAFHFFVTQSGNASLSPTGTVQTAFDAGKLSFLQNTNNIDFSRKYNLHGSTGDYLNLAFGGEIRYEQFKIVAGEPNSYILGPYTVSGAPFVTPVYPGTGNSYTLPSKTATSPGAQVFPGYGANDAITAHRMAYAAYADVETRTDKWTLGGALRFEDYAEQNSINYSNLSGKVSVRYEFTPALAVRASVSNGFRAPSLHQRYFQNTSTQFLNSVAQNTLTVNNQNLIARQAFGIGELKPETSKDITLGLVGKIGNNFTYTVDAYLIRINDRIVLSTSFSKSNGLVQAIFTQYNVDPSVSSVQFWTNAVNTQTKGVDIVLTEKLPLLKGMLSFSLAGNINRNEVVGGLHASETIQAPSNNPSQTDASKNPGNDFTNILFDRQQRSRIEVAQPQSKFNFTTSYGVSKWNFLLRMIYWGKVQFVNAVNNSPFAKKADGSYWYDTAPESDQTFSAKITTDVSVSFSPCAAVSLTAGANNLFDIYPDQQYIDPRNTLNSVYATPVVTTPLGQSKAVGGYAASRDATSRGRFLYPANQFGFNGRYIYARLGIELTQILKTKR